MSTARKGSATDGAPTAVSLFSGAGGLDLGANQTGFRLLAMNECDASAAGTLKENFPNAQVLEQPIEEIDWHSLGVGNVDCIMGGPPCQAFSVFGGRKGTADRRGRVIFQFFRAVDVLRPQAFLVENVRGLLSTPLMSPRVSEDLLHEDRAESRPGSLVDELVRIANGMGYHIDLFVVNAVNYGSPQIRERVFLYGNRSLLRAEFPLPTHSDRHQDGLLPFATLGDAIGEGFEDADPECVDFSPRKLKYLDMIPPGGNWRSLPESVQRESMGKAWYLTGGRSAYWRKLSFAFPSPTVVTMPNHAGTSMCHPTQLRAITVGEAAAIQEFPHDYQFVGTPLKKMRQIGNAVPVGLARVACAALFDLLERAKAGRGRRLPQPGFFVRHLRPHVRARSFFAQGEVLAGDSSYAGARASGRRSDTQMELFDGIISA